MQVVAGVGVGVGAVWKHSCSTSSALSNSLRGLLVAAEAQKSLLLQDQTFLFGPRKSVEVFCKRLWHAAPHGSVLCGRGPSMAG